MSLDGNTCRLCLLQESQSFRQEQIRQIDILLLHQITLEMRRICPPTTRQHSGLHRAVIVEPVNHKNRQEMICAIPCTALAVSILHIVEDCEIHDPRTAARTLRCKPGKRFTRLHLSNAPVLLIEEQDAAPL